MLVIWILHNEITKRKMGLGWMYLCPFVQKLFATYLLCPFVQKLVANIPVVPLCTFSCHIPVVPLCTFSCHITFVPLCTVSCHIPVHGRGLFFYYRVFLKMALPLLARFMHASIFCVFLITLDHWIHHFGIHFHCKVHFRFHEFTRYQ